VVSEGTPATGRAGRTTAAPASARGPRRRSSRHRGERPARGSCRSRSTVSRDRARRRCSGSRARTYVRTRVKSAGRGHENAPARRRYEAVLGAYSREERYYADHHVRRSAPSQRPVASSIDKSSISIEFVTDAAWCARRKRPSRRSARRRPDGRGRLPSRKVSSYGSFAVEVHGGS